MPMKRVLVTRALGGDVLAPLEERYHTEVWDEPEPIPRERLLSAVGPAHGLLCMLTEEIDDDLLASATQLEVVSQMAVGVDNIDVGECERRGIAIGHTPDVLTETVADTAFALLASVVRRLPEGERVVREGRWGPWSPSFLNGGDLHDTTMGIIGYGRIGRALARRCVGFDMEVIYASPREAPGPTAERLPLQDLLERADHVMVCVSLTPETRHLIGSSELESMKPSAFLVNVSRGPVVDTEALLHALRSGSIAGAALDVTDPEPLPADHPLLELENCLVVPHIASSSVRAREAMARLAVENLVAGLEGREMPARYRAHRALPGD